MPVGPHGLPPTVSNPKNHYDVSARRILPQVGTCGDFTVRYSPWMRCGHGRGHGQKADRPYPMGYFDPGIVHMTKYTSKNIYIKDQQTS